MIEQPDPTICRCGTLLAFCADCRAWLIEHSARIASDWRWRLNDPKKYFGGWGPDEAEEYDRQFYLSWRHAR